MTANLLLFLLLRIEKTVNILKISIFRLDSQLCLIFLYLVTFIPLLKVLYVPDATI